MAELRKLMDGLPFWLKIVLALPVVDGVVYGIYRICKGTLPNVVLGIVWIFAGTVLTWILDIVFLLWKGKVFEL